MEISNHEFFPLKLGNIKDSDFEEYLKNNSILNELRNKDILNGNCGTFYYRYFFGGCRDRAYGFIRNYLEPDPGCLKNYNNM